MEMAWPTPPGVVEAKYVVRRAPGRDDRAPELTISPDVREPCSAWRNICAVAAEGKRARRSWTWLRPPTSCHTRRNVGRFLRPRSAAFVAAGAGKPGASSGGGGGAAEG